MSSMQRIPVESSDLVSVGYNQQERVLEIEFKENRIYRYVDVPPDIYEGLMHAESYGLYFNSYINMQYRYSRVRGGPQAEKSSGALAFVTGNARKAREMAIACKSLGVDIEQVNLPIDEIQAADPEKVALHKAKSALRLAKRPVVINNEWWSIPALHGFPGPYMKDVTAWLRIDDFLALMQGKTDRTICLTQTIVYHDDKRHKVFAHDYWGKLLKEPRGPVGALPIEQLVVLNGSQNTLAENNAEARSSIMPEESIWREFAIWYNRQRRMRLV